MPPILTRSGDFLEVKIEGRWSEIAEAKDKVKAIPGRRWDPAKKVWVLPAEPHIADRLLKSIRPEVSDELMAWIRESMTSQEESLTSPLPEDAELLIPWATQRMPWQPEHINDEKVVGLLDYQRAAVDVMAASGRMLLADEMGLGKTIQAISAVEEARLRRGGSDGPRLIIAPASVLGSWERELRRWLDEPEVVIVNGNTPAKRHDQITEGVSKNAWIVVNWEQIRIKKEKVKTRNGGTKTVISLKEPLFEETAWFAVIADEIHRAKNHKAQQSRGLHRITGEVMFGLTGTPILNSPDELWSILRWLWPTEYHERGARHAPGALAYWTFYTTYVDFWEDHFGRKNITGVLNPDALRFALKGKVVRRLSEAGGRKRIYEQIAMTPKQQKLYTEAEKAMWLAIAEDASGGNADALEMVRKAREGATAIELMKIPNGAARFVRLQQIIENAALLGGPDESALMDDFEQKFEDSRPEQWIVFCKFKESCSILAERLRKRFGANVAIYTGDVSAADRTDIENEYQAGEIDVIIGTIGAMREGITLTAGHLQYWLTRDVVPANNEQGEARQDRIGQQHMVYCYIPQAQNTIAEGKIHQINKLKEGIVKSVLIQGEIEEQKA